MSVTKYLDQMLDPVANAMPREFAEFLVSLKADPELQQRLELLREKAARGTLNESEDAEYQDFVEALDVISILQLKARKALMQQAG